MALGAFESVKGREITYLSQNGICRNEAHVKDSVLVVARERTSVFDDTDISIIGTN